MGCNRGNNTITAFRNSGIPETEYWQIESIQSTAVVTVTPGQEEHARISGHAKSEDGLLALELAMPQELGGRGQGTNPEQLFAAGSE